jgi:hypothetical protein
MQVKVVVGKIINKAVRHRIEMVRVVMIKKEMFIIDTISTRGILDMRIIIHIVKMVQAM